MSSDNADETLGVFETALKTTVEAYQPSSTIEERAEQVLEAVYGLARSLTSCAGDAEIEAAREKVAGALSSFKAELATAMPKAADPAFTVSGAGGSA